MIQEKNYLHLVYSIEEALETYAFVLRTVGLKEGFLGLSLFNYYRYLSTKDQIYLNRVSLYLDQSLSGLSAGYKEDSSNLLNLIEIAKYLCFLHVENIVDTIDIKEYLEVLNPNIKTFLHQKIKENDLDAVCGIVAVGHYYVDSHHLTNHDTILTQIVNTIDELSISSSSENSIYWEFNFRDMQNPTIEPGFLHGIAGVLFFLSLVFEKGIQKETCKKLIERGIRFLQKNQKDNGVNLYPFDLQSKQQLAYQNLVYGDLGIGYAIYRIGNILNHSDYEELGIHILENAAKFRDSENILIKDAELIYGASGLFAIYSDLASETKNRYFKSASEYWLNKLVAHSDNDTPWAGYDTYINGFDKDIQLSFSHGICGIGIALMSDDIGLSHRKYLTFFNYK